MDVMQSSHLSFASSLLSFSDKNVVNDTFSLTQQRLGTKQKQSNVCLILVALFLTRWEPNLGNQR